jgi:hypothetical protein
VVLGYHGCDREYADALMAGEVAVEDWRPSRNAYDWLGHGIYFWEHAPGRARAWADRRGKTGVVGAVIDLGRCLDFTDTDYTAVLGEHFARVADDYRESGLVLPANRRGRNDLDCLVVNDLVATMSEGGMKVQSVRCPFLEGEPAFPGSAILKESHIQVAVVDPGCILGVFRPNTAGR